MENIFIIDKFLDNKMLHELLNSIEIKKWKYGHSSGNNEIINNRFFANYELEYSFVNFIKERIENYFSKKYKINRNYMHIQTFGQDGGYHIDDDNANAYTLCLYISDISDTNMENANGDFLIKIPNEKVIICIETFMNRCLFFPSNYRHKGMAYNCLFSNKRLCLTWKLDEIN